MANSSKMTVSMKEIKEKVMKNLAKFSCRFTGKCTVNVRKRLIKPLSFHKNKK